MLKKEKILLLKFQLSALYYKKEKSCGKKSVGKMLITLQFVKDTVIIQILAGIPDLLVRRVVTKVYRIRGDQFSGDSFCN